MKTKHKFQIGDKVTITLPDWKKHSYFPVRVDVECIIASVVEEPFGYNVISSEPIHFRGFFPSHYKHVPYQDDAFVVENQLISTRKFFVLEEEIKIIQSPLLTKVQKFFSQLEFRKIKTIHSRPQGEIEYIKYYSPDNKVVTIMDDKNYVNDIEERKRLAYKMSHFFGFAEPLEVKHNLTKSDNIHFTVNRFGLINFWKGLKWDKVDGSTTFKPEVGNLICGIVSNNVSHNASSMDEWFVSSPQFHLLCDAICVENFLEKNNYKKEQIVKALIIPKNEKNYYIPYEPVLSRYIYAAIYLIVKYNEIPPEDWTLPKRKGIDGTMQPFHIWWPNKVIED